MQNKLKSYNSIKKKLLEDFSFVELALEVFHFQYTFNAVYKKYVDLMGVDIAQIKSLFDIPFLPIEFFKSEIVSCEVQQVTHLFESSGTTSDFSRSRHYISDIQLYQHSILEGFGEAYGSPSQYVFMGLLPSYLERNNASLVYMVDYLIQVSGNKGGFYLDNFNELQRDILRVQNTSKIPFVFGVSFALLDFAESYVGDYHKTIFIETGGMKGRKKEVIRAELHQTLKDSFNVFQIHSEYGMTEMLSQAYSKKDGIYKSSPWMRVLVRDGYNPLQISERGKGLINIIDVANLGSCSFLATQDVGEIMDDGQFVVSGRSDNSEVRGCNLMVGDW